MVLIAFIGVIFGLFTRAARIGGHQVHRSHRLKCLWPFLISFICCYNSDYHIVVCLQEGVTNGAPGVTPEEEGGGGGEGIGEGGGEGGGREGGGGEEGEKKEKKGTRRRKRRRRRRGRMRRRRRGRRRRSPDTGIGTKEPFLTSRFLSPNFSPLTPPEPLKF